MKISEIVQRLLPFGYLFLVLMGIMEECMYYYQIGINILRYSTIMDILISPIATLTSNPVVLVMIVILGLFFYAYRTVLVKNRHKKWVQKTALVKNKNEMSDEVFNNHFTNLFIGFFAVGLLAFFLGLGLGGGLGLAEKIADNKLEYRYKLNYGTGESEQIYLIGSNSIYYFYLAKGNKSIKISPIGAIKSMEITSNKKLK